MKYGHIPSTAKAVVLGLLAAVLVATLFVHAQTVAAPSPGVTVAVATISAATLTSASGDQVIIA